MTVWKMTACRFSFSSSISRRCSDANESIFDVVGVQERSDGRLRIEFGDKPKNDTIARRAGLRWG